MQPDSVSSRVATYELRLYGPLRLSNWLGQDLTPRSKKAQGLLAILAVAKGSPVTRAALQDKLWSDRMPAQGRDSLRQALHELRAIFRDDPRDVLRLVGDRVSLDPDCFHTDSCRPDR